MQIVPQTPAARPARPPIITDREAAQTAAGQVRILLGMAVDLADLRAQVRELEAAERAQQETVAALLSLIPGTDATTKIAAITPHAALNESERACLGSVLAPLIPLADFLRFLSAHECSADPGDPEMRNGLGWVHQFLIEKTGNLWGIGPTSAYPRMPGGKRIGPDVTLPPFAVALVEVDAIITAASARAWLVRREGLPTAI